MPKYKVIAFDADDTLWVNEPYFREAEDKFAKLLSIYETENKIQQELYKVITGNIPLYGYGVKSCILSMIQCATELSNNQLPAKITQQILNIGKEMLSKPIELLPGIEEVLKVLSKKYTLIVLTKGDLLDQEKKLERSGLLKYFHHVEVMSEKNPEGYQRILKHLDIAPKDFLMIGNSLKSDVLPVLNIGAEAIHIPFHSIWQFEIVDQNRLEDQQYKTLSSVKKLLDIL
ncbi:HAD family hydrolase [Wenyingzhuangia marina]|uniref:Putative hydrolase of the HAD superfamily n=1 Tax=Wenyingzhuangia marina TaxID=1195760 RepID=A0A1M5U2D7_9FLAO|nr:HAD family hydrolase [Wenyingzhuangia marina]GGF69905.1 haloacid dehalogenase [Wenyingzhuangia marina]SHH57124.1 putative hydrolase of the HAD superfamily [Wenyingzhuangia marina]